MTKTIAADGQNFKMLFIGDYCVLQDIMGEHPQVLVKTGIYTIRQRKRSIWNAQGWRWGSTRLMAQNINPIQKNQCNANANSNT